MRWICIRVRGGNTLNGVIPISGAKNAALPLDDRQHPDTVIGLTLHQCAAPARCAAAGTDPQQSRH
jgi:hypothetical protein